MHDLTYITNYPTASYGRNLYIHKTNNDNNQQPWLCINQVPYEQDKDEQKLEDIRNRLNNTTDGLGDKISIIGLHRKYRGLLPTTLLLYKTETATAQNYLLNNDIRHNQHKLKTRLYIHKTQMQCTNCNKLGHKKTHCKNNYRCVKCGKNFPLNNCKNKINKCTNCNGPHTATSRQCDKLRQHIDRRYQQNTTLTYVQVLNRQQHKLDITQQQQQQHNLDTTQQQQTTKLLEIQTTLTTLQEIITEATENTTISPNTNKNANRR